MTANIRLIYLLSYLPYLNYSKPPGYIFAKLVATAMYKTTAKPFTGTVLTAEARESLLENSFADHMSHYGELFIPDDDFYTNKTGRDQAGHMLLMLCRWLGIKPGYIGLVYEISDGQSPEGRRFTIEVKNRELNDEFLLGAVLAYALTRYLVEEKKQLRMPPEQQDALLAAASVEFGLGLVIMNGLSPVYGWADNLAIKLLSASKLAIGSYDTGLYTRLVKRFCSKYRVQPAAFRHSLAPWTSKRLGLIPSRHPTKTLEEIRRKIHLENMKLAGMCWLLLTIIGVFVFVTSQRVDRPGPETVQAYDQMILLNSISRKCQESVAYNRQYADLTDIQTVRNLNAEHVRCESINNQRQLAEQDYARLTKPR